MNTLYKKTFKCIFLLIFFAFISIIIKKYFKPFLIIIILSVLCMPLAVFLDKYIKNRKITSLIVIISINILIFITAFNVGNYIYSYAEKFISKNYKELEEMVNDFFRYYNNIFHLFNLNLKSMPVIDKSYLRKGALYTTDSIIAYFIANIATYFIISDRNAILDFIKKVIGDEIYAKLKARVNKMKNVISIEIWLVIISAIITTFGFFILRIPNALLLGFICGVLDILPYVGTIIVFIPLLMYNIVIKRYFIAIGLIFLYILGEIIRQILETKFISDKLDIHPLAVLIAIYIGIKSLGITGLIIGPLYVVAIKDILIDS